MSKYIPNAFQIPNDIVDEIMAGLSGNAVKCYLLIVRKTLGWNKQLDFIPASQFHDLTGIKKADTLTAAIKELEVFELIVAQRERGKVTGYRLNLGHDIGQKAGQVPPANGGTSAPAGQSVTGKNQQETIPENQVHPLKGYTRFEGVLLPHSYIFLYPLFGYTQQSGTPDKGGYVPPANGGTSTPEKRVPSKPTTKPTNTKPKAIKKFDPKKIGLPENIDREIWAAFIDMRNQIKKPVTERAANSLIKKLINFEGQANASLDQSIVACWQDVYAPKDAEQQQGASTHQQKPNSQQSRPYSADELQAFKPVVIHEPDKTPNPAARAESARIAAELAKTLATMED